MTLDWGVFGRQALRMGEALAEAAPRRDERVAAALAALGSHADEAARLNSRLDAGHFAGVAAGMVEHLDYRHGLPDTPAEYTVGATDGSLIEPDRHGVAYYFVVNIGSAVLRYGERSSATLSSEPALGYKPEDLYLVVGDDEVRLEGGLLRVRRAVMETERLAAMLEPECDGRPLVGLLDGTLIPWLPEGHGGDQPGLREALLGPLTEALARLEEQGVPIASYVSRPRSNEVVNTLRVAECPHEKVECRKHCPRRGPRHPAPCDRVSGIDTLPGFSDRHLLEALPLGEGERSALFASRSKTMEQYHAEGVYFCYVNVGPEIARLEMPAWVARDPAKCDLVHAVVYDQCRRGGGYPRALTEAHEKAVIGTGDRQHCDRIVELALGRNRVPLTVSAKAWSKTQRGI